MKNLWLMLFVAIGAVTFTSCDKDALDADGILIEEIMNSTDKVSVEVNDLDASLREFTDGEFFETYIEAAYVVEGKGYGINMENCDDVYFDKDFRHLNARFKKGGKKGGKGKGDKGGCQLGEELSVDEVPATIAAYISTNYPDAEIMKAKVGEKGYFIGLSTKTIVLFDSDENFVKEHSFIHDGGCKNSEEVEIAALPATITDYITTNYPTADIKGAKLKDALHYIVGLYSDDTKTALVFDAEGNFVKAIN